jgi:hypothetical protein
VVISSFGMVHRLRPLVLGVLRERRLRVCDGERAGGVSAVSSLQGWREARRLRASGGGAIR